MRAAIERSVDKSMTSVLLHAAGVPTPPTWAIESPAQAQRLVMRESAAGHALVLKPLFGSQGKGVQRVGAVDGVHRALPPLSKHYGSLAYLQRFIAPLSEPGSTGACWWSAAAPSRRCAGSARTGCTTWRRARACVAAPLAPQLAQLAQDAARALDMDYAGVDILPTAGPHRLQVIEVNGVAAWQGLQRVSDFNIARAIVDDLLDIDSRRAPRRRRGAFSC